MSHAHETIAAVPLKVGRPHIYVKNSYLFRRTNAASYATQLVSAKMKESQRVKDLVGRQVDAEAAIESSDDQHRQRLSSGG